jgi:hypothetical protein
VVCQIGGYSAVREAVDKAGANVLTARTRAGVLAFGADADVHAAFDPYGITQLDLHTIEPQRLRCESGERGLLRNALTRAITRQRGLNSIRHRSSDLLTPVDPQDVGWMPLRRLAGTLSGAVADNPELVWCEGIAVRLDWADDRLWLLVEPCTVFEGITETNKAAAADFARERSVRRYNSQLNDLIAFWAVLLAGDREELRALGNPHSSGLVPDPIRVATLTPAGEGHRLYEFMRELNSTYKPTERRGYLPDWPGFRGAFSLQMRAAGGSCHIELDAQLETDFRASPAPHVVLADRLVRAIHGLEARRAEFDVLFIYLPQRWAPGYVGGPADDFDLHDHVKAATAARRLPVQLIREDKALAYPDRASVMWRVGLALYVKAGGIPWKLAENDPDAGFRERTLPIPVFHVASGIGNIASWHVADDVLVAPKIRFGWLGVLRPGASEWHLRADSGRCGTEEEAIGPADSAHSAALR